VGGEELAELLAHPLAARELFIGGGGA
jgi:hypothetical protein